METNDFEAFVAYFRKLATEHKALAGSFVHGPVKRIVQGTRTKFKYPLLWLETPALVLEEKDGTAPDGRREGALLVLINIAESSTTDAEKDAVWAEAERIMLQVVARLRRDRKQQRWLGFRITSAIEPINTLTVNNEYGWRVEFEVTKTSGLCYDASQWEEGGANA